jgi:adenylate cyclase
MEIERKFLVKGTGWRKEAHESWSIEQGYLAKSAATTIRVRVRDGKHGSVTIKSRSHDISRHEFEYEVPIKDARALLRLCGDARLSKRRYRVARGDLIWEIDEFRGRHRGLVIAEVELTRRNQKIELPDWIGKDVSTTRKYQNSYLALGSG